jgi:hypothetical protein
MHAPPNNKQVRGRARNVHRLSLRIPWLLEAVAEGPLAITMLIVLVLIVIAPKVRGCP